MAVETEVGHADGLNICHHLPTLPRAEKKKSYMSAVAIVARDLRRKLRNLTGMVWY